MRLILIALSILPLFHCPCADAQEGAGQIEAEPDQPDRPAPMRGQRTLEPLDALPEHPDRDREEDRGERNLAAQEEIATWSRRTFYGSLIAISVSAAGLAAIVYSLRLNTYATKAAQDAVKIADTANELQNRAWVSADCTLTNVHDSTTHLGVDGTYATVLCRIKNHGRSPAVMVRFNAESIISPSGLPEDTMSKFAATHRVVDNATGFSLFPGDTAVLNHVVFFPADDIKNNKHESNCVHVAVICAVTYSTANATDKRQTCVYHHICTVGDNGTAMVVEPTKTDHLPPTIALIAPPVLTAT